MEDKQKISFERSVEAAKPVREISDKALELDTEYLKIALEEFRANHLHKESIAVLDPRPLTHKERQELDAAKIHQLDLIIQLGENAKNIFKLSCDLDKAERTSDELGKIFK